MPRPIAALLVALLSSSTALATPTRSEVVHRILKSSVHIQVFAQGELQRSATGVIVHSDSGTSFIITNAHVTDPGSLKNVTYLVLLEEHGRVLKTLPAKLVAQGHVPELDLALLSVNAELPPVDLGREESIDVGDEVIVVGAPYGRSLSISGGLVSQLETENGPTLRYSAMKTDAAIGYGCSGGGVFETSTGQLIGIVEGYRTARVAIDDHLAFDIPMPGETFLAPITKVRRFLDEHLPHPLVAGDR